MKFFFIQKNKGFTLIEMLVAVLIFSISLVSLMTIASRGIASNRSSQNEISAQYLAAEGIEAVRHIRDSNYVAFQPWLTGASQCISEGCFLTLQPSAPYYELALCGSQPCSNPLEFNTSDALFGITVGGDPTVFTRTITLEEIDQDQVKVFSEVRWNQGELERIVTMTEILRNWQNNGL
jgi:prepilin-type N-terminal cleavage/methylation domain-containing protein